MGILFSKRNNNEERISFIRKEIYLYGIILNYNDFSLNLSKELLTNNKENENTIKLSIQHILNEREIFLLQREKAIEQLNNFI